MSYSSLFVLNKELKAEYVEEFKNSWLFPIPIFKYLINKYASEEEKEIARKFAKDFDNFDYDNPINLLTFFMFDSENKRFNAINSAINNSESLVDRIGWELVNQQMFSSQDKEIVSDAILVLQKKSNGDLQQFEAIAKEIKEIDTEKCPYFIFKNNSIDDGVEKYFSRYNEETDEEEEIGLREYEGKLGFDLVVINNGKMTFERPLQGVCNE